MKKFYETQNQPENFSTSSPFSSRPFQRTTKMPAPLLAPLKNKEKKPDENINQLVARKNASLYPVYI